MVALTLIFVLLVILTQQDENIKINKFLSIYPLMETGLNFLFNLSAQWNSYNDARKLYITRVMYISVLASDADLT
jgi:hypothetical protein